MFEFDQNEVRTANTGVVAPHTDIPYASNIVSRSMLFWSEHCIECAAPDCYQSCDLFRSRPDKRCRRFKYGTRQNKLFKAATGRAAEIVFDRWGKLEARGNSYLIRSRVLTCLESVLYGLLPLSNWIGKHIQGFSQSSPWSSLSYELMDLAAKRLHAKSLTSASPDGFLIEIYNPDQSVSRLTFECSVSRSVKIADKSTPLPVLKRLELGPGYNRYFFDYHLFAALVESGMLYKFSLVPEKVSGTHLVFISLDFVKIRNRAGIAQHSPAVSASTSSAMSTGSSAKTVVPIISRPYSTNASRPAVKCVVFDLDNTLWNGVLIEEEITLKPKVLDLIKALDRRGVLLSIASKNNAEQALAKLDQLGLREFFVYPMINWSRKSDNIKRLAEKLSIGIDTLLFVDDSPFEREEVATAIPEIEVLAETKLDSLLSHDRLAGGTTIESVNRRALYQQQIEREAAQMDFGDDYLNFLKECEVVVSICASQEQHRDRIEELLQRTNQLNFSGTKYSRDDVARIMRDETTDKHVIHCRDKFGDYGVVGFSITKASVDKTAITVLDFMLSCRVQGKLIEKAFFNYLSKNYLNDRGQLKVNFKVTERNALAQSVLQDIGFDLSCGGMPVLQIEPGKLDVDFLETKYDKRSARILHKG